MPLGKGRPSQVSPSFIVVSIGYFTAVTQSDRFTVWLKSKRTQWVVYIK